METEATFHYYDEAEWRELYPSGGPIVRMGRMETAEQFFARLEGRRGTRVIYDEALAWARDALDSKLLTPTAAVLVESHRALVMAALRDDPHGTKPPTREVIDACMRLAKVGAVARFAPAAEKEIGERRAKHARDEKSKFDCSKGAIKRRKAVKEIVAELEKGEDRVTAQAVADELVH